MNPDPSVFPSYRGSLPPIIRFCYWPHAIVPVNTPGIGYTICPAYDLVPSAILLKEDTKDMALHLNGEKHKLKKKDFSTLFRKDGVSAVQADRIFQKMEASIPEWVRYLKQSFVDEVHQERFQSLIFKRAGRMDMRADG